MTANSDYFFLNLKQLYPAFRKPAAIDVEIWEEELADYSQENIHKALKSYRKSALGGYVPTPIQFRDFLYPYKPVVKKETLPLSPETYLMDEDIRQGRCKHLFPTYVAGVRYVLNEKLKDFVDEELFNKMTRGMRYRAAVDYGLFADFDQVLDIVAKKGA